MFSSFLSLHTGYRLFRQNKGSGNRGGGGGGDLVASKEAVVFLPISSISFIEKLHGSFF